MEKHYCAQRRTVTRDNGNQGLLSNSVKLSHRDVVNFQLNAQKRNNGPEIVTISSNKSFNNTYSLPRDINDNSG